MDHEAIGCGMDSVD